MLSGSPIILENFCRTEVLGGADKHHHHQFHSNFTRNHRRRSLQARQLPQLSPPQPQHIKQQKPLQPANQGQQQQSLAKSPPLFCKEPYNLSAQTSTSKASNYKTTAMSAFNSNQKDAEYPIINVEAENEHFTVCDSVISWIEANKTPNSIITESLADGDAEEEEGEVRGVEDVELGEALETATEDAGSFQNMMPHPSTHHQLSAPGMAWNLVRIFSEKQGDSVSPLSFVPYKGIVSHPRLETNSPSQDKLGDGTANQDSAHSPSDHDQNSNSCIRMRGNDEWAPPRAQIIFNIHEETQFKKLMHRQNYRCAGCGTKIDLELARKMVLYCHYLGKYFCKCCFSHKAIHLPGYILQKWDFHKYPVSHFALQLLDRIANEPLFNINDINPSLYRKAKKLRMLVDIRMQLYYLKIYISTCTQTDKLDGEYSAFTHQHLLQDDVHLYSLNNLIEIQHGKLYEYLNDLVSRSITHIAQCDRCRAKGHYCQLCGPSSLMSSMILNTGDQIKDNQVKLKHSSSMGQNMSASGASLLAKTTDVAARQQQGHHSRSSSGNYSNFTLSTNLSNTGVGPVSPSTNASVQINTDDYELIFPFEIGRVAQCRTCGCCFHLQCFLDAGKNCPKCERIQRRKAEMIIGSSAGSVESSSADRTITAS